MNVLHIAWRELRGTFQTSVGWLVLCGYLLITGVFWLYMVENYAIQSQDLVFSPYAASMLNLTDYLLVPFFGNCAVVLVMITPALSMRLFSEELKQRTMELLLTSPVSTWEIVLGKYLGAVGGVLVLLLCSLSYPLQLMQWADPPMGVLAGSFLALFLLSAALLSMGMLFSSFTSSQIVALVLSFVASLGLLVLDWGAASPESWNARLSLQSHLNDMLQGAIKLSDVAYFVLFAAFFLFATVQRMESFRWR